MQPVIVKVSRREAEVLCKLTLETNSSLLDVRLHIVARKQEQIRIRRNRRRWRCEVSRIRRARCGKTCYAVQINASDLNSVLRVGSAHYDRWRAVVEDTKTGAQHCLVIKGVA